MAASAESRPARRQLVSRRGSVQKKRKMEDCRKLVVSNIRSLLISAKGGVAIEELNNDYRELIGGNIPFRQLGYQTLADFLDQSPDMCRITKSLSGYVVHPRITKVSTVLESYLVKT